MDGLHEHPARVQVSATKKPLHFYVELAKRFLQEHGQVQLSAIGLAIPMMVNLAEILKGNRWATEIKISTGLYQAPGEPELPVNGLPKAKMEIVLSKSVYFDDIMAGRVPPMSETLQQPPQGNLSMRTGDPPPPAAGAPPRGGLPARAGGPTTDVAPLLGGLPLQAGGSPSGPSCAAVPPY
ncbi:g5169 [Coccomyxa elongata]